MSQSKAGAFALRPFLSLRGDLDQRTHVMPSTLTLGLAQIDGRAWADA